MMIHNINNMFLNTGINFNAKRYPLKNLASNLSICDTINIGNKEEGKPNMLKYTKKCYYPKNNYEKNFIEALEDFSKITDSTSDKTVQVKEKTFLNAFNELLKNIFEKDKAENSTVENVLCSMIETFDKSENTKFLETLDSCLFEDFIPYCESNEIIKKAIEFYTNSDILNNQIFKIRLKSVCKK